MMKFTNFTRNCIGELIDDAKGLQIVFQADSMMWSRDIVGI